MHKSKFRLLKAAIAWFGMIFFFGTVSVPMVFAAENTATLEALLQSCENSAAAIQTSNQEILQSLDQMDEGIDGVRIRIRRSHSPRHP